MKKRGESTSESSSRRNFLKKIGAGAGALSVTAIAGASMLDNGASAKSGETVKLLSPDGTLVEVDKDDIKPAKKLVAEQKEAAREGLPNRKFTMVIDLARCKNARKCVEACQEGHLLPKDHEWMKLYLLQDDNKTSKYWFPRPCFHCD